ncbi:hypothetical protein [uncultured Gammaproteobacteria bacterium]|nr:hypothetical protein [uncultured Gammaproteobacteria bacterium]
MLKIKLFYLWGVMYIIPFFKVNVNVELFVVKANIFNKPRRIYTECLGE